MRFHSSIRNRIHAALVAALIAVPAAGQGIDELFVFPAQLELAVGATSTQPVVAIERYDDGWVTDMTQYLTVSIADPGIVETVAVAYDGEGDLLSYVYLRGLAAGSTTATVSAGGLTAALPVTVVASQQPAVLSEIPMAIGSNLTDLAHLSSELVFSDVFMTSQPWVSSPEDNWGTFPQPLDVNDQGWVDSLLAGQVADTMMLYELDGHYPKGSYTLTWQGSGTIVVEKGWTEVPYPRVDHPDLGLTHVAEITVGASDVDAVRLRITATDPANPIHDIHLWMPEAESGINPGNADTPPANVFRESYLEQMSRYSVLRFGIWQLAMDGTDNLGAISEDVTPVDYATQFHPWGASPEWAVRLINELNRRGGDPCTGRGIDPWIIIPYLAEESYVRALAELFATEIDFEAHPTMRIHVEWAAEVWNPAFEHFAYAAELGGQSDPVSSAMAHQVQRSLEAFAYFEDVFTRTHPVSGGMDRVRRVLSGAAGGPWFNTLLLNQQGAAAGIDAFAIAPYFGGQAGIEVNWLDENELPTPDGLLDMLDNPADPDNLSQSDLEQRIREIAQAAAMVEVWSQVSGRTIDLVAYESGQHLAGAGYDTQSHVVSLFADANNHPRMGEMYRKLMLAWHEIGGSTFNHFLHREKSWSSGLAGALLWYDEDETTPNRPKYQALLEGMADSTVTCGGE